MRVLLVDVDGLLPNLALMKLSAWHKRRGDETRLLRLSRYRFTRFGRPERLTVRGGLLADKAYISCVFDRNRGWAYSLKAMLESLGMDVEIGGVGVSLTRRLPDEVEHIMPDYALYGVDYSMGFTSRGCIRKCPWCIVWRKEGWIKPHASIHEFLHPSHRKLVLLDNNLLASPTWEDTLLTLIRERVKVCFTQGLDIRLINRENAKLLALTKHYDLKFRRRRLYFSFDHPNMGEAVSTGVETLKRAGIPPSRLLFYMLTGFNVTPQEYTWEYFLENDWSRFTHLKQLGVNPFIMRFNGRRDIPLLTAFSRWVNHMHKAKKKSLGLLPSFTTYLKHEHPQLASNLKSLKAL